MGKSVIYFDDIYFFCQLAKNASELIVQTLKNQGIYIYKTQSKKKINKKNKDAKSTNKNKFLPPKYFNVTPRLKKEGKKNTYS